MFESMYAARGVGLAAPQNRNLPPIAVVDVTFKEIPTPNSSSLTLRLSIKKAATRRVKDVSVFRFPREREPR